MQIAYNAGQYEAMQNDEFYTHKLKEYYMKNNLGSMTTYMNSSSIDQLNDTITQEMINKLAEIFNSDMAGGMIDYVYKAKYEKYKYKYLKLKLESI